MKNEIFVVIRKPKFLDVNSYNDIKVFRNEEDALCYMESSNGLVMKRVEIIEKFNKDKIKNKIWKVVVDAANGYKAIPYMIDNVIEGKHPEKLLDCFCQHFGPQTFTFILEGKTSPEVIDKAVELAKTLNMEDYPKSNIKCVLHSVGGNAFEFRVPWYNYKTKSIVFSNSMDRICEHKNLKKEF